LAALIATMDNAMMVSPSGRPASRHQKYHKIAGMGWYAASPNERIKPQKSEKTAVYGMF
jgi:hypothetical protein